MDPNDPGGRQHRPLQFHVLNAVTDDYEDLDSVVRSVRRDLTTTTATVDEVAAEIIALAKQGLLNAFTYNVMKSSYDNVHNIPDFDLRELWFLISDKGRHHLDAD
jgi:hypothetical protein